MIASVLAAVWRLVLQILGLVVFPLLEWAAKKLDESERDDEPEVRPGPARRHRRYPPSKS